MQTLYALDITGTRAADWLWRRQPLAKGQGSAAEPAVLNRELPPGGFTSPLGYCFAAAPSWTSELPLLRVEFSDYGGQSKLASDRENSARTGASASRTVRTRLRLPAPAGRGRTQQALLPLTLEINHEMARIGVDAETWESVRETVLLIVAQFWRFSAIDRQLDELSDWARRDLAATAGPRNLIWPRRARALRAQGRSLQALILDLPHFEAALTNPRGWLAAGPPVRLFRALATRLGLNRWRHEIDERIEVVEAVFDSLAESLNHHQSLAFHIALELVIVALLLLDVGLFLADVLARK
jgi:hypothetical protein